MKTKDNHSCCSVSRSNQEENSNFKDIEKKNKSILSREKMALIPKGNFLMGTEDKEGFSADGEGPIHEVSLNSFYIDSTTVTNGQFKNFVEETGYVTDAEKFGWSFVFAGLLSKEMLDSNNSVAVGTPWWYAIEHASWSHPEGAPSSIEERMSHPVVHVSWNDAIAFCEWSGKRLPTEAEWEYAARGGLEQKKYPWGDELTPNGTHRCNIWQGNFPDYNSLEDGFLGTAPVKSFEPNGYGLFQCVGNVWEWCHDWFSPDSYNSKIQENPQGPNFGSSKVMRGGSFLCHKSYCNRYRVAARSSNTPDSSTSNIGFRCVANS